MASTEEILDIVDLNDQVVESLPRSVVYERGNLIIRGTWLFIQNSKGQLWIPRRVKSKKLFPDALDGSIVGHVSAGETYEEAIIREAQEECNLDLKISDLEFIGKMAPHQLEILHNGLRAFIKVFVINMEDSPNFNKDEYSEYYWLTPEELIKKIEAGDKHKNSLPYVIKHLFISNDKVS